MVYHIYIYNSVRYIKMIEKERCLEHFATKKTGSFKGHCPCSSIWQMELLTNNGWHMKLITNILLVDIINACILISIPSTKVQRLLYSHIQLTLILILLTCRLGLVSATSPKIHQWQSEIPERDGELFTHLGLCWVASCCPSAARRCNHLVYLGYTWELHLQQKSWIWI